ncbi:LysR substrate-binding domain-containing protein [Nesterenkonia sp. NBAIMH1]|uniref:LysR substrate-binding domain-containing protein n=1 Tax=Nesterenkonia sp. NBAIMH1 TaxID=2600320 RepID=UPI00143D801A|nr:LysR substrate-binding domain-containing protein [Nesterenkonia sp. NBAIMH1]
MCRWIGRGEPSGSPPALVVDSTDSWLDAVAGGRGIGVTTSATSQQHRPEGLRYLRIAGGPTAQVSMIWPKQAPNPLVGAAEVLLSRLFAQ